MIKCPGCGATLPDAMRQCQFCGTNLQSMPPAVPPYSARNRATSRPIAGESPGWIWPAYYGVAIWWILNGLWNVFVGLAINNLVGYFILVLGGLTAVVGFGLILKLEMARGVVNVLCFVQIAFGLLDVVGYFLGGTATLRDTVGLLVCFVQIGLAAFMIFLIGETDSGQVDL